MGYLAYTVRLYSGSLSQPKPAWRLEYLEVVDAVVTEGPGRPRMVFSDRHKKNYEPGMWGDRGRRQRKLMN